MAIGPIVRRAFGPLEPAITNAYRRVFFDVRAFAAVVAEQSPATILEVGCGEGAVAEAITAVLPEVRYVGIDIARAPGRLFRGPSDRVEFHSVALETFAARHRGTFDAVVMCDVLHHVPTEHRRAFLRDAVSALRPGGLLIVKEWERRRSPVHAFIWFSDRVITGDTIRFETGAALRALFSRELSQLTVGAERRLPPCSNNICFVLRNGVV